MPNDVYRYAHAALSALVSPRVAHALLEEALAAKGQDQDTVTTPVMRQVLAGSVRKELAKSLPRAGLTVTLKRLADELAARQQPGSAQPTPVRHALIKEAEAERAVLTLTSERLVAAGAQKPADEAPAVLVSAEPAPAAARLPGRTLAQIAADEPRSKPAERPAKRAPDARLSQEGLTRALKLFGDIETVTQVVVVRRLEVVLQRGHGIDATALPGLVLSSRHLLARSGDLRALSVERASGVLFLFPFGEDSVVVVTLPNVNIGAVLNARAALEEAA